MANLPNSQPTGRQRTSRISKRTLAAELEILTQAFRNVIEAGGTLEVSATPKSATVTVALHGVALVDGLLVPLTESATQGPAA